MSNAFPAQGVLMTHANARLTVHGRALLVDRILAGHRPADVAAQLGCSRATAYTWLARYRAEGPAGLADPPSRPHRCPHRTRPADERRILAARRRHRRDAQWIGDKLGLCPSTVGRVLARHKVPHLCELDALTGEPVRRGPMSRRRYERATPGELIHVDVKKLGRIPDGGGWRAHGRGSRPAYHRRSATSTSTRRSTITPARPTRRSTTMRRAPPAPAFSGARRSSLPGTASRTSHG